MLKLLFTCEHAGMEIPLAYTDQFKGKDKLIHSAHGYDIGAYQVFQRLVAAFNADSYYTKLSKLVIDMNRSLNHKDLFSKISKRFSDQIKQSLIYDYYLPYRKQLELAIFMALQRGYVIHISVHSFAPRFKNKLQSGDIGILYDSKYSHEKEFAELWKQAITDADKKIKTRFNYPYKGSSGSLTSHLRDNFKTENYYPIKLELNQKHLKKPEGIDKMAKLLITSLEKILAS